MADRMTLQRAYWRACLCGGLLLPLAGCALMNGFLDPTKVGHFPTDAKEGGIRRVLTARDTPGGIANAADPTPEDLVVNFDDYRVGPGDAISISVADLIGPGDPFTAQIEVSSSGDIRLPQLGSVRVAGLTEQQAEVEIKTKLQEAGILPNPIVLLYSQVRRGRVFSIVGSCGSPGTYPIAEPDLRLLDAISLARDVGPEVKRMYVIRRAAGAKGFAQSAPALPGMLPAPSGGSPATQTTPPPSLPSDGLLIQPEDLNDPTLRFAFSTSGGTGQRPDPAPRYARASARQDSGGRAELDDAISPGRSNRSSGGTAGGGGGGGSGGRLEARPESNKPFAPLIFEPSTGSGMPDAEEVPAKEIESTIPGTGNQPARQPVSPERTNGNGNGNGKPFSWDDFADYEGAQRVIEIDVRALKNGDPRYNIVIRDRDIINVPVDIGVYYLMGEVQRPGVYTMNGREITVKQALATAGGFSPLAWPKRAEVIRREQGTDKQTTISVDLDKIFAGLEDDFYLRDEDIINVGSDVVAPFLFVVRNSFRFTYGFGFVYDRNFADRDSYFGQSNPADIRRINDARRGLPF